MPYLRTVRAGWLLLGLSWVLLLASVPEGRQQGYLLLTMIVTLTFAIIILAGEWMRRGK